MLFSLDAPTPPPLISLLLFFLATQVEAAPAGERSGIVGGPRITLGALREQLLRYGIKCIECRKRKDGPRTLRPGLDLPDLLLEGREDCPVVLGTFRCLAHVLSDCRKIALGGGILVLSQISCGVRQRQRQTAKRCGDCLGICRCEI